MEYGLLGARRCLRTHFNGYLRVHLFNHLELWRRLLLSSPPRFARRLLLMLAFTRDTGLSGASADGLRCCGRGFDIATCASRPTSARPARGLRSSSSGRRLRSSSSGRRLRGGCLQAARCAHGRTAEFRHARGESMLLRVQLEMHRMRALVGWDAVDEALCFDPPEHERRPFSRAQR